MKPGDKDALAKRFIPLVDRIVFTEKKKLGRDVDVDDLRSFALEGLAEAIERFDETKSTSFKAFAQHRIRGAIYDGAAEADWFPRRLRRKIAFYRKAEELLETQAETPPPADKVEAVHRLADTLKELATAYITSYTADEENEPASEPAQAEYLLEKKRYCEKLRRSIDALPEKRRNIIYKYFFEDLRLVDIAEQMGVTKSWISRLVNMALDDIRSGFPEPLPSLDCFQPPG